MENFASAQLLSLSRAVLSGLAAGVFYDLLRCLRLRRCRSHLLTHLSDGLFVLFVGIILLYLTLRVGEGELRLYLLFGAFGGALLWWSAAADLFRPLLDWWLDTFLAFIAFLQKPVCFLFGFVQKLYCRAKRDFLFLKKYATLCLSRWRRPKLPRHGEEDGSVAKTNTKTGTKRRRANPILLLILLVLIVLVLIQIVRVYTKYEALQAEEATLTEQAENLQQENDALRSDLAKKDDPAFWEQLARKFADMVKQGERIFIDPNY